MSLSAERDNVIAVANSNPQIALTRARQIADGWYRCQALAHVAWHAEESGAFLQIIGESIESASTAGDAYRCCAVLAWPLRALIERGYGQRAKRVISIALARAEGIVEPVSKCEALSLLWQAAFPLQSATTEGLRSTLIASCRVAFSWRSQRCLRDTALMVAADDPGRARQTIADMPDGPYKRQAQTRFDAGRTLQPRPFFK